jgi:hypothetical protein
MPVTPDAIAASLRKSRLVCIVGLPRARSQNPTSLEELKSQNVEPQHPPHQK